MPLHSPLPASLRRSAPRRLALAALLALLTPSAALAEGPGLTNDSMLTEARGYYAAEMRSSFYFLGFGAISAGAGGVALTQSGRFAEGLGWSSLIGGGVTALGGAGYAAVVKLRGDRYKGLAETDPARFKIEEGEHIDGTNGRFVLYAGAEIATALVGVGIASYGIVKNDDLFRGIGLGTAIQGIGLLAIDLPGILRASAYEAQVRRFHPTVGFRPGHGERPWGATLSASF